jgi:catalase
MSESRPVTTTDAGIPAPTDEHSLSAGPDGPLLPQDHPRTLWEKVLTETDREHLVGNIVAHAGAPEVTGPTRRRVADYRDSGHADLGARVADGILGEEQ